jgi:hypothetical protein
MEKVHPWGQSTPPGGRYRLRPESEHSPDDRYRLYGYLTITIGSVPVDVFAQGHVHGTQQVKDRIRFLQKGIIHVIKRFSLMDEIGIPAGEHDPEVTPLPG